MYALELANSVPNLFQACMSYIIIMSATHFFRHGCHLFSRITTFFVRKPAKMTLIGGTYPISL